jgi:Ca2+/Na+ antiporter
MIAGGTLLGLGAAGLISSIMLTRCNTLEDNFACKNQHNSTFAVPATAAATLLGAVLLFVGVGYRVRYKKWENWKPENAPKTAVYPTLLRGGAGVGYSLRF